MKPKSYLTKKHGESLSVSEVGELVRDMEAIRKNCVKGVHDFREVERCSHCHVTRPRKKTRTELVNEPKRRKAPL